MVPTRARNRQAAPCCGAGGCIAWASRHTIGVHLLTEGEFILPTQQTNETALKRLVAGSQTAQHTEALRTAIRHDEARL